jgi:hypothetical protein
MLSHDVTWSRWNTEWWEGHAKRGGLWAGAVFALFEVGATALLDGGSAAFRPLRLVGSLLLGPEALDPDAPLGPAVVTGGLVHLGLSALFGVAFGSLIAWRCTLGGSSRMLIATGVLYGLGLWLVNVYSVAPVLGWTWFPVEADPLVQAVGHALFFGLPLALYVDRAARRRRRLGLA